MGTIRIATPNMCSEVARCCLNGFRLDLEGDGDVMEARTCASAIVRRTMMKSLLGFGTVSGMSSARLLLAAPGSLSSWNFGVMSPQWQTIEIANGDTLVVPALVAGTGATAILDSGSGASIISTSFAARIGLSSDEQRTVSGLSGKAPVRLVRNVEVSFGGAFRRLPFVVAADLGAASAAFGRSIDVILGEDMLRGNCIALDFANSRLALAKTGSFAGGTDWAPSALGRGAKRELFISASIEGRTPVPLMFDLGNSTALMLSSAYLEAQGLLQERTTSTAAYGGVEGVRLAKILMVRDLTIGPAGVVGLPALGIDNWLSVDTVGNIGLPLIAQFDVMLDVTAGFVWFRRPPSRHRLPMLKDRSGLGLAGSADALTVVHVALSSPASAAGWVAGERIVAINGHPVDPSYTRGSLWAWRFDAAGTVVKLELAGGSMRELTLADYY